MVQEDYKNLYCYNHKGDLTLSALDQRVLHLMEQRDLFGRQKHGTPLQVENGRDFLIDAIQELLDGLAYLEGYLHSHADLTNTKIMAQYILLMGSLRALVALYDETQVDTWA